MVSESLKIIQEKKYKIMSPIENTTLVKVVEQTGE
jgi:hypothetical protein